jgi:hypothetical protein
MSMAAAFEGIAESVRHERGGASEKTRVGSIRSRTNGELLGGCFVHASDCHRYVMAVRPAASALVTRG